MYGTKVDGHHHASSTLENWSHQTSLVLVCAKRESLSSLKDENHVFNNMNGNAPSFVEDSNAPIAPIDVWDHSVASTAPPPANDNYVASIHLDNCKDPTYLPNSDENSSIRVNQLSLIDEWPKQTGLGFSTQGFGLEIPQKKAGCVERRELDKNIKRSTTGHGLAFHRRQGSGELYTKLRHFDNENSLPCKKQHCQSDNFVQGSFKFGEISNRYVVKGHGCWGDFDNPLFSQSLRADEKFRSPTKPHAGNPTIPEASEYENFPPSTGEGIPLPSSASGGATGGGGGGGVLGLKEWYKNRTLVSKATSKVEAPPKPKYLRKLVLSSWKHNGSGAAGIFNMLSKRPLQSSPIIALKALITVHKLLQQGAPSCRSACYSKLSLLTDIASTSRSEDGRAAADPYNLLVSTYASLIVAKVSFHNMFPAYESNYSIDFSAITSHPSSTGDVSKDVPRVNALAHLQHIQDVILAALEEGFALLRKKHATVGDSAAGMRTVPTSSGGETIDIGGSGDSNPVALVVGMLIPVLREADLVYDICWFLLSSQLHVCQAGRNDPKNTVAVSRMTRKFEAQHKLLRNFFEQAKSEVAITCTVAPPNLPLDPPCQTNLPNFPNNDNALRFLLRKTLDQKHAATRYTTDLEPGALVGDFSNSKVERPDPIPLEGKRNLEVGDLEGVRDRDFKLADSWANKSLQPAVAGKVVPRQLPEVIPPVVGGVGAAAAAAMQRFAAGQAEARRAAAVALPAGLKNIRLEPPPGILGFNLQLELGANFRPQRPQHTRGIGRTWSSFDDEAFLHQKLVGNPWSPIPKLVTPKFYSPRAPGPSKDASGILSPCNLKSSSPLLLGLVGSSQIRKPVSPIAGSPPAPIMGMELKQCPLLTPGPQMQPQQVQDPQKEVQGFPKLRLERPETPPMIEMDTPVVEQLTRQAANQQSSAQEQHHLQSVPPASWQLVGSMSDAAAWSDCARIAKPGDVGLSSRKENPKDTPLAAEWEIPASELKLGPKIGQGAFGDVLRGTWQGTDVAVKRLQNNFGANYFQATEEIRHEVAVIMRLRHPNIILFMGACTIPPEVCIVMEFAANGSLFGVLHNPNIAIDMATVVRWASEAARGMNYLHTRNPPVVHRDLKSVNLLVDGDWHIKVSDFGLALTKQSSYAYTQVGTWGWMAPEVLESAPYNEKADVYSFGIVLWELITREEPFKGCHPMQIMRAIDRGERPAIPLGCPQLYKRLVTDCWHADPKCRPVFVDILVRLGDISNALNTLAEHQR